MNVRTALWFCLAFAAIACTARGQITYPIVDTGQSRSFSDRGEIAQPEPGERYFGQDAHYAGNAPSYRVNADGTVSDLVTGLMWTQRPPEKLTYAQALSGAQACDVGGHTDWRLPTVKELYSLIRFNGVDPDPQSTETGSLVPFIDDGVFGFSYGDPERGERVIDAQFVTSTKYVSTTMRNDETVFGVNFADGRIKGYPVVSRRGEKTFFVLYVRGNPEYGTNRFRDNGDGTVSDEATGLTWMLSDSGEGMDWPAALEYAENLDLAGHTDWRLPNAKELQSIVDYTRSPATTGSAAIDPVFESTELENEAGQRDFGFYWTGTTHRGSRSDRSAVYVAFGRSGGFMQDRRTGAYELLDVHGAGSQRSDPKVGDASRYPRGRGPQGDVIRIANLVRCVRGGLGQELPGPDDGEQATTSLPETPNFIVIVADDMGWTGTSVQMDDRIPESKSDYYKTPNLERLAREGMRFSQAYAPGPLCTPTRAALLTGWTPAALHVTTPGGGRTRDVRILRTPRIPSPKLGLEAVTIAETLKEAGYATATLGKWHLGNPDPGAQGFDTHDGINANDGPGHFEDPNPKDIFGITQRATAFMTEHKDDPFYVQLWHYAPHSPTRARAESVAMFTGMPRGDRHTDPEYAAMTYDLDASIGMILDTVEELGLAENTYVLFMSDNGAAGGRRRSGNNQPLAGGKGQLSEGGIRVPLIVRGPGVSPGALCRTAVTGVDLFPTFCALAGVAPHESIEGDSVVPLLVGDDASFVRADPSLLFHFPHYGNGPVVPHSALVVGKYKIIREYEGGNVRLYDLEQDISEANDLATTMPAKAEELERMLDDRLERANAQMPSENPEYDPEASPTNENRRPRRNRP